MLDDSKYDARSQEAKDLIAAGKLSAKDPRNVIQLDFNLIDSELVGNLLDIVTDVEKFSNSDNSTTTRTLDKVEPEV